MITVKKARDFLKGLDIHWDYKRARLKLKDTCPSTIYIYAGDYEVYTLEKLQKISEFFGTKYVSITGQIEYGYGPACCGESDTFELRLTVEQIVAD